MSLRYGVLSLLVLFAIFILALKNYETWTLPNEVLTEKGVTKKSVEKIENPPAGIGQKESTDIRSYIFVSEKNIFSSERKEFPIIAPPQQGKQPIGRPQIILYGVTMAGDYQSASIVHSGRPVKQGERQIMSVKVGDQIGEFKLAKILPDRIMMEAAEDSFEVLLYDPRVPKQRTYARTEAKPATVTSTLPGSTTLPAVALPPTSPPIPGTMAGLPPGTTPQPAPQTITPTQPSPMTQTPQTQPYRRSREQVPNPSADGLAIGPVPQ
jgi:hypothetical protein